MKEEVTFSCGHKGIVEVWGKSAERERMLEYKKSRLCVDCWKKAQEEKNKKEGLVLNISLDTSALYTGREHCILLWFSGDTMPNKDKIKAKGFMWGEMPDTGMLGFIGSKCKTAWHIFTTKENIDEEIKQLADLNMTIKNHITDVEMILMKKIMAQKEEKNKKDSQV